MSEFIGFPREFISFFKNLKKNNSKEWFENNRKDYEKYQMHFFPMQLLIMRIRIIEICCHYTDGLRKCSINN